MPISVFPERMDKLDPEDVNASLRTLETYVHYICERTEFAITNIFRTTTGLGSSAEAISLVLQEAVDNLSAISSQLAVAQTDISRLQDDVGGLEDTLSSFEPLLRGQSDGPAERVVFTAPGEGLPLKACTAEITPVQEGEGDPSPENVRPIAGWTGLHLYLSPTEDAAGGKTYTVDWTDEAGTVAEGTLDLLTGALTVTMVRVRLTSAMAWSKSGSGHNAFYVPTAKVSPAKKSGGTVLSNIGRKKAGSYNSEPWVLSGDKSLGISTDSAVIGGTTIDAWKAYLDTHEVYVAYELETPEDYALPPRTVTTLAGANNIWSDTGDVTVEHGAYLAALQVEIERLQEGGT